MRASSHCTATLTQFTRMLVVSKFPLKADYASQTWPAGSKLLCNEGETQRNGGKKLLSWLLLHFSSKLQWNKLHFSCRVRQPKTEPKIKQLDLMTEEDHFTNRWNLYCREDFRNYFTSEMIFLLCIYSTFLCNQPFLCTTWYCRDQEEESNRVIKAPRYLFSEKHCPDTDTLCRLCTWVIVAGKFTSFPYKKLTISQNTF